MISTPAINLLIKLVAIMAGSCEAFILAERERRSCQLLCVFRDKWRKPWDHIALLRQSRPMVHRHVGGAQLDPERWRLVVTRLIAPPVSSRKQPLLRRQSLKPADFGRWANQSVKRRRLQ